MLHLVLIFVLIKDLYQNLKLAVKLLEIFILTTIIEATIIFIVVIEFTVDSIMNYRFIVSFVLININFVIVDFASFVLEFINLTH